MVGGHTTLSRKAESSRVLSEPHLFKAWKKEEEKVIKLNAKGPDVISI